jgi:hypothetical protein
MESASATSLVDDDKVYASSFAKTSRGNVRVSLYNYTYAFKRQNKKDSLYRCSDSSCNASITINDHDMQVIKVSGNLVTKKISKEDIAATHKHDTSELDLLAKNFEFNLVSRAASEGIPLPRIYQQEQSKAYKIATEKGFSDQDIARTFKTFHSKKGAMDSHKADKYPINPKTLDDIVIDGDFSKCENGERFLLKDIKEFDQINKKDMRLTIFGSDTMLKILCEGSLITSDGTFDFAADHFFQVYILMSYFRHKMFPCVYTLMNCKTQVAYERMLNEIRLACLNIQLSLNPKIVMTDFEAAAIGAYKNIWKTLQMLGCFFHYGNCLYKNLCDNGMRKDYLENEELRNWFRRLVALALVPFN